MRRVGQVITVLLALVAFVVGFGGVAGYMMVTQPAAAHATSGVQFDVQTGDTTAAVANRLQTLGVVRNAVVFRALARYRHLDRGIEPGVYNLTPAMTMDQIILKLQKGIPDEVQATVPDGLRVTQYPAHLSVLKNFDAKTFMQIAKTGKLPDGTDLSKKYWYVEPLQPKAAYALEGYLFPDTYDFNATDDTTKIVERMLDQLGEQLCPGPASNPTLYIYNQAQCKAHATKLTGTNTDIFTAMEQHYFTKDDAKALYQTLTIASLTAREISHLSDAPGVTGVYYTRFAALTGHQKNVGDVASMGSDPSAEYARDTDKPPTDGHWWRNLADAGKNIDPGNPYNTDVTTNPNLPPGPIAAPLWTEILAAANPPSTAYYYFITDNCGKVFYAKTFAEFNQNYVSNPNFNKHTCPAG